MHVDGAIHLAQVEYDRWLYPEKYDAEQKAKEAEDERKWQEIQVPSSPAITLPLTHAQPRPGTRPTRPRRWSSRQQGWWSEDAVNRV